MILKVIEVVEKSSFMIRNSADCTVHCFISTLIKEPLVVLTLLEQREPEYPLRQAQTFGWTHRLPYRHFCSHRAEKHTKSATEGLTETNIKTMLFFFYFPMLWCSDTHGSDTTCPATPVHSGRCWDPHTPLRSDTSANSWLQITQNAKPQSPTRDATLRLTKPTHQEGRGSSKIKASALIWNR